MIVKNGKIIAYDLPELDNKKDNPNRTLSGTGLPGDPIYAIPVNFENSDTVTFKKENGKWKANVDLNKITTDIQSLKTSAEKLNNDNIEINKNLNNFSGNYTSFSSSINSWSAQYTAWSAAVELSANELSKKIEGNEPSGHAASAWISETFPAWSAKVETSVDNLNTSVTSVSSNFDIFSANIETSVNTISSNVNSLSSSYKDFSGGIITNVNSLSSDVSSLSSNVNSLSSSYKDFSGGINSWSAKVETSAKNINDNVIIISGKYNDISGNLNVLSGDFNNFYNKIEESASSGIAASAWANNFEEKFNEWSATVITEPAVINEISSPNIDCVSDQYSCIDSNGQAQPNNKYAIALHKFNLQGKFNIETDKSVFGFINTNTQSACNVFRMCIYSYDERKKEYTLEAISNNAASAVSGTSDYGFHEIELDTTGNLSAINTNKTLSNDKSYYIGMLCDQQALYVAAGSKTTIFNFKKDYLGMVLSNISTDYIISGFKEEENNINISGFSGKYSWIDSFTSTASMQESNARQFVTFKNKEIN